MTREWYYAPGGQQRLGPVTRDELAALLVSGRLSAGDPVWRPGMADWSPAGGVPELADARPAGPPLRVAAFAQPPHASSPQLLWVTVPVLISGIANVLSVLGVLGFSVVIPCCLIALPPLVILAVFEFVYFNSAASLPPFEAAQKARTLGVCEIVAGALTFNIVVLVCGVIALVNAGSLERR